MCALVDFCPEGIRLIGILLLLRGKWCGQFSLSTSDFLRPYRRSKTTATHDPPLFCILYRTMKRKSEQSTHGSADTHGSASAADEEHAADSALRGAANARVKKSRRPCDVTPNACNECKKKRAKVPFPILKEVPVPAWWFY